MASCIVTFGLAGGAGAATFGIETLDLGYVDQGWGSPQANKSVDGHTLSIGGKKFEHGLGTHASSSFRVALNGKGERFTASVGVYDEIGHQGSVVFKVIGDGKTLWESGVMRGGEPAKEVSADLRGIKTLVLSVGDAGDGINYDHADWADAQIAMLEGKPEAVMPPREPAVHDTLEADLQKELAALSANAASRPAVETRTRPSPRRRRRSSDHSSTRRRRRWKRRSSGTPRASRAGSRAPAAHQTRNAPGSRPARQSASTKVWQCPASSASVGSTMWIAVPIAA